MRKLAHRSPPLEYVHDRPARGRSGLRHATATAPIAGSACLKLHALTAFEDRGLVDGARTVVF
jgi:hypothetical protein